MKIRLVTKRTISYREACAITFSDEDMVDDLGRISNVSVPDPHTSIAVDLDLLRIFLHGDISTWGGYYTLRLGWNGCPMHSKHRPLLD